MRVFDVMGRITGNTSQWMKRLGWKNIKSIKPGLSNEIIIGMKEQPDAGIRFLEPGQACIVWSVEDFEGRAEERWEFQQSSSITDEYRNATCWQDVYDESKFEEALHKMIDKHDASLGICWDTIDIYLDDMCMRQTE